MQLKTQARFVRLKGGFAGEVTCDESRVTAKLMANGESPAKGGIETVEFANAAKPSCPSTLFEKPAVELTVQNPPYAETKALYSGAAAPQGELLIPKVELQARVLAEKGTYVCTYKSKVGTVMKADIENGTGTANTKLQFKKSLFQLTIGDAACPTEGEFNATYEVRRSDPQGKIYIAN